MKPNVQYDKGMIIRTVILMLALINQLLVNLGYSPLPFDDKGIEIVLTTIFTIVAALVAWWKDNRVSYRARRNNKYLKDQGLK